MGGQIMQIYQPGAIVLQCGADSLCGDRLGCFNLSIKGHADCVRFVPAQKLPTLILGGGGYTIRNVSRCWTYETAVILGAEIDDELPYNDYYEYYGPDYRLHFQPSAMENLNIPENLEKIKSKCSTILDSFNLCQMCRCIKQRPQRKCTKLVMTMTRTGGYHRGMPTRKWNTRPSSNGNVYRNPNINSNLIAASFIEIHVSSVGILGFS